MKQLDAGSSAYRALIEKELAIRLGNKKGTASPAPDLLAHPGLGEGGKVGPTGGGSTDVCTCGTTNDADARFCKSCGAKLRAA